LIFYDYLDDLPLQPDREGHFGITRGDSSHKPAWTTIRDSIAYG
jgi:hypothetical protein